MKDAFSKYHPAVNFLFFLGAFCTAVLIQHPAYLLSGCLAGTAYYLLLNGKKGIQTLLWLLPLFIFLTAVNPLFNTRGNTILFSLFDRPYTLEAMLYGAALAGMTVVMLLWFGCYNKVLTSDKFTSLFGNLIPAISLILVMVLRLVPNFIRKLHQLFGARRSIGKGAEENATFRQKLTDGTTVLGALIGWAMEGSIVTGDSMRARGYGAAKRNSFMIYRMKTADWLLMAVLIGLLAMVAVAASLGQFSAVFTPAITVAPVSWGLIPYTVYLLIPTALHIKEAIQWHISRSRI